MALRGENRRRTTSKESYDLSAIVMKNIHVGDTNEKVYIFWVQKNESAN